jgi:hypothetical protein
MSWSVSASGTPEEVLASLDRQFAYPLAEGLAGLADAGEQQTVRLIYQAIKQCLGTFDPERPVAVSANGHMGFSDWETKTSPYQQVSLSIGLRP